MSGGVELTPDVCAHRGELNKSYTRCRDVYKFEGPTALFKGLGPTLVGVVPGRYVVALSPSPSGSLSGRSARRSVLIMPRC